MMAELFAAETLLFGAADLIRVWGWWPEAYRDFALPSYLPIATATFVISPPHPDFIFIPLVQRMMAIADPFFEARTPISIPAPGPLPADDGHGKALRARTCIVFLILINQLQVAISVRFNFWQRDFGNAIQVADEPHRLEFWSQLINVFAPLAAISILAFLIEFFVTQNFVLQWRRWMTASYTSRVVAGTRCTTNWR